MKLFFALLIFTSIHSYAGQLKELVIEAEEAIQSEMYHNADRIVQSISNYRFVNSSEKLTIAADVVTLNPLNNFPQNWICNVFFEKTENVYKTVSVECR